ncbi:Iroquois-class homeodomain protein IRX-6 [Allomyces javanicus]|nr:Iroquois-class homeodomain protein IRX-6 [Allomyces javanicus]
MHGTYPASQAQAAAAAAVNNPTHMRSPPVHHPRAHAAHAHAHHAHRAPLPQQQQHAVAPRHGHYAYAGGPWPPGPPHAVNPAPYPPTAAAAPPPPQGPPLTAVPYAPIEPHARHATNPSAGAPHTPLTWSPPSHEYPRTAPGPHHDPQPWPGRDMDGRQPPPPQPPLPPGGLWVFVPSGAAEPPHYPAHPRYHTTSARGGGGKHEVDVVEPEWPPPGAGMPPVHAHAAPERDARWRRGSGERDWTAHAGWTHAAHAPPPPPQATAPAPSSAGFVLGGGGAGGGNAAGPLPGAVHTAHHAGPWGNHARHYSYTGPQAAAAGPRHGAPYPLAAQADGPWGTAPGKAPFAPAPHIEPQQQRTAGQHFGGDVTAAAADADAALRRAGPWGHAPPPMPLPGDEVGWHAVPAPWPPGVVEQDNGMDRLAAAAAAAAASASRGSSSWSGRAFSDAAAATAAASPSPPPPPPPPRATAGPRRRGSGKRPRERSGTSAGALDRPLHTYTAAELNAHIGARKKRRNFTKEARSVLFAWLDEHEQDPYPTEAEKRDLAAAASLTVTQINYWFVNARRRTLRNRQLATNAAAMAAADVPRASGSGAVRTLPQQPPARAPAVAATAAWHGSDDEDDEEDVGGALSDELLPLSDNDSDGEYVPEQQAMGKPRRGGV